MKPIIWEFLTETIDNGGFEIKAAIAINVDRIESILSKNGKIIIETRNGACWLVFGYTFNDLVDRWKAGRPLDARTGA